jgi:AsmA protein
LQVRVGGRFAIGFTGDLLLVMNDVHVRNSEGAEVLSAEHAVVAVEALPLLFNQRRVRRITLAHPRIVIERGRDGILGWTRREKPRGRLPVLANTRLSLTKGSIEYRNLASGSGLEANAVALEVRGLRLADTGAQSPLAGYSFRARLACQDIRAGAVRVGDVNIAARAKGGVVALDPVAMRVFGGRGSGSVRAELTGPVPRIQARFNLSRFRVEECLRTLSPDTVATGALDVSATLSLSGRAPSDWSHSLAGEVILRGRDLSLHGHDLDAEFSRFESSQNLDLVDVGSFFLVGPLGVAVTKGYDFARLLRHSEGTTRIGALVSSWDIKDGGLKAKDVALATAKNRIALQGRLDFVNQRFDSVAVALVDKEGCAKVRQELHGTFQKPELKKPTVLMSLLGPARRVYKRAKDLMPGDCTAFYEGSVAAPE